MEYLTVVTYNLDCKSICQEERLKSFGKQIEELDPSIIAIQEGTRDLYSKLFLMMKQAGYKFHQFPEIFKRKCGEVIFTKWPILEARYIRFQYTEQNRGLSVYTISVHDKKIKVVTTQLECGSHRSSFIKRQITQINQLFQQSDTPVILLGDFQISSFHKNIHNPKNWVDAWEEAGISKETYSVDSKINTLATVQDRPDRVWFLSYDTLECEECRLIGLPTPRKENFFASEHFGVRVKFVIK